MWIIEFLKNKLLKLLFPLRCFVCGKKDEGICLMCLENMKRAVETPSPETYSYFSYKDPNIRKILQKIKYFRKIYLIKPLVYHVVKDVFLLRFLKDTSSSIIIPIPMSNKRRRSRGGNHAYHIAKEFLYYLKIPMCEDLLIRKKDSIQQVLTHSKSQRISNMRGSFTVNEKLMGVLLEKRIILVDDVTTTGSTIHEAKSILEKGGFKNIVAITLAH